MQMLHHTIRVETPEMFENQKNTSALAFETLR